MVPSNFRHGNGCGLCTTNYADIYMAKFEEKNALEKCPLKPHTYLRFVDDVFIIWTHGRKSFDTFLDILNSHEHGRVAHSIFWFIITCSNKYSENTKSCKALVIMYINKFILFTFS